MNAGVAELLLPLRFFFTAVVSWILIAAFMTIARGLRGRLLARNFRGDQIPVVGGLVLLLIAAFLIVPTFGYSDSNWLSATSCGQAVILFALLGLVDDWFGDRMTGGFRGHIQQFVSYRHMTTGLIKAVGGLIAALYIAAGLFPSSLLAVILAGLLIALGANTINLFDLRPGRATLVSIILLIPPLIIAAAGAEYDLVFTATVVLAAAFVLFLFDRQGLLMLGDAGSNALGAAIGVLYVCVLPTYVVAIGVVLLIVLQIWCEGRSINQLIAATPWLRRLDAKVGIRGETTRSGV